MTGLSALGVGKTISGGTDADRLESTVDALGGKAECFDGIFDRLSGRGRGALPCTLPRLSEHRGRILTCLSRKLDASRVSRLLFLDVGAVRACQGHLVRGLRTGGITRLICGKGDLF